MPRHIAFEGAHTVEVGKVNDGIVIQDSRIVQLRHVVCDQAIMESHGLFKIIKQLGPITKL